jgi:hypothetical protein
MLVLTSMLPLLSYTSCNTRRAASEAVMTVARQFKYVDVITRSRREPFVPNFFNRTGSLVCAHSNIYPCNIY